MQAYVKAALDKYGKIDCFFNNAGIEGKVQPTHEYDEALFDQVIDVNVKGVFLGLKTSSRDAEAGRRRDREYGVRRRPDRHAGMSAYVASKHAVLGLTKQWRPSVARGRARQRGVSGPVDTRMIHSLEALLNPGDPGGRREVCRTIPSGRYTTPEEIANMVLFLCSDLAADTTGGHFVVDGGRSSGAGAVTGMVEKKG